MSHQALPPPDLGLTSATDPSRLYLSLLGGLRLYWSGELLEPPGPKLLALLVYLHLRGRATRNELAEVFWPDSERRSGLQSVRQALTQLRKQPGAAQWLHEDEKGLFILAVSEVSEFRQRVAQGDDAGAISFLGPGELLSGLPAPSGFFSDWLEDERAALKALRGEVWRRYGLSLMATGALHEAREVLNEALLVEVDDEELYRALMELEYQAGDLAQALEVFERCRRMLKTHLETEPAPETLALLKQIEGSEAGGNQRGQLLTQGEALPQGEEPLFGREAIRQKLSSLLTGGARVLLHGLGGLGKTRVASAVAATFLSSEQKVVWLEIGRDPAQSVLATIRELLQAQPAKKLSEAFAEQGVSLVVLDNATSAYATPQILAALPADVPVLLTSRLCFSLLRAVEIKRLDRESALQVLQYHLKQDQLGEGHSGEEYRGGEEPAPLAATNQEALCALLGDHPFALRLAALTLARGGTDVIQKLYAAPHDTIRALLEQSLDTVSPREYEVFLALGSLYAPQVTPELLTFLLRRPQTEVEEAMWGLTERGLLSRECRAGSDTLSFRMHDLTWHAARERQAHLPHHLVQAVTEFAESSTDNPDLLGTDLPHLLGAASDAPAPTLTRLMAGWLGGGYIAARGFPTSALHLLQQATEYAESRADWETASLLGGKQADIAQALLGNQAEAVNHLLKAAQYAEKAGNRGRQAVQLALAGQMQAANGWAGAWEHLEQAQTLARTTDAVTQARVLGQVAMTHAYRKEFIEAHHLLSEAREVLRAELFRLGQKGTVPEQAGQERAVLTAYLGTLGNLGQAEKRLGNLAEALALKQEMGELAAEKDERLYQARAALDQGELLHELGRPDEALAQLRQAIAISQSIGSGSLEGMARRLLQDIASAH